MSQTSLLEDHSVELPPVKWGGMYNQLRDKISKISFYIESEPQNIAEEILELAKSIRKDRNNNVTVSCIYSGYGKLNEK